MNAVTAHETLNQKLTEEGMRSTRQREVVYDAILEQRDHPTADEVHARVRTKMAGISLATVYNCLETLVQCNLVKQVNFERESTRYCPNLNKHAHFHDDASGRIYDINLENDLINKLMQVLPEGYDAHNIEINFRGKYQNAAE
jgi:Fur family peroxide stress response transcriptional regulator